VKIAPSKVISDFKHAAEAAAVWPDRGQELVIATKTTHKKLGLKGHVLGASASRWRRRASARRPPTLVLIVLEVGSNTSPGII
jgi:hypothetical protein